MAIDGYSLKASFEIIKALGYFNPKKDVIIPVEKIDSYLPSKVIAICTGSQGEENASLMRIANKRHKHIKITKDDTVILSSSVIPGNEKKHPELKR